MKKILLTLLVGAFLPVAAQMPTDTVQVASGTRENSAQALHAPYVILISADGFRYDYAKKYHAEHLLSLSSGGVRADAMVPSFPSITFPNHWSIITGLYPSHHGLVDNYFYDYKRKDFYSMSDKARSEDGSWYGGVPLWALAGQQGMVTASMMWVGSASDAAHTRPNYYYHYNEKFSPEQKVDKVIGWLKLPEKNRPHFIALYFPEVDASGHKNGTEADATEAAVHLVDNAVGRLSARARELGLEVNFIFVSDHGMINVDLKDPIDIPPMLLDKSRFEIFNSNTMVRVVVKNPVETKAAYKELLKNKTKDYDVYLEKRVPKYLHYNLKEDRYQRIGDILMVAKAPKIFLEKDGHTKMGKHGYDPRTTPEMKATFLAWGPAFREGLQIPEFSNVNVYPLAAHILGLKITSPIDGKLEVLEKTLKK